MSICFDNLRFAYGADGPDTLSRFSATFEEGKITLLTGPSGCGKSTLLYLAAGIYPHGAGTVHRGRVTVDGLVPDTLKPPQRCALVGMMFQNPELQFCMDTVENELVFCLENICTPVDQIPQLLSSSLAFCDIPHLQHRTLLSLSGGERQKVMLACLVALKPRWLLLDEPFANVDDASACAIAQKLGQMRCQFGTSILAVDHRLDSWLDVADSIRVMEDGTGCSDPMTMDTLNWDALEALGISVPDRPYGVQVPPPSDADCPILTLENLSLRHGTTPILSQLSARFYPGHIYAIVGNSGCGKSSLFGALSGLYPYEGTIHLDGHNLKKRRKQDLGKLGFVTQSPQDQFLADSVYQELAVSLRHRQDAPAQAESILRDIGLWRYRYISAYMLSQGQQRRLGVAALMAYDCRVLVCDEPTYAQDRRNTLAILQRLSNLVRERQIALIFSTHDRQLAKEFAHEVLELKGGALVERTQSRI